MTYLKKVSTIQFLKQGAEWELLKGIFIYATECSITLKNRIREFFRQGVKQKVSYEESLQALKALYEKLL